MENLLMDEITQENPFERLPDELLILIFCYLNHRSRLACRAVCRHWLMYLDNSAIFHKDRHLFLRHCQLSLHESPVRTLTESCRDYYSLKLGRVSLIGEFRDLTPFFDKLAQTVVYLDLTELKCEIFGSVFVVFERFKRLKTLKVTLKLGKMMWEGMCKYLRDRKYKESYEKRSITDLFVTDLSGDALLFERFLQEMPVIERLSIISLSGFTDISVLLQMHGNIIKHVGPNVINIYHSANRVAEEQELKELTSIKELQLESLESGWRVDNYNVSSINKFLSKQEKLQKIALECYGDIPADIFLNVTHLTVRFDDTITSFSKLTPLIHLTYLDFCISESYRDAEYREIHPCFFGHESIPLPALKTLGVKTGPRKYIYMTRDKPGKSCYECWATMLSSVPNLESLKFCHHKYLPEVVQLILDKGKSLREMTLINLHSLDCFLLNWKPMPRLQHLELWQATKISFEGVKVLCQKSPNLTHLRILGGHLGQPDQIVKHISLSLSDLEILELDFDSPGVTKHAFAYLYLIRHLKILGLGNHEKAQLSEARKMLLFEHLPELRIIHDIGSDSHTISRIDFLELKKKDVEYKRLIEKEYEIQSTWKKFVAIVRGKY